MSGNRPVRVLLDSEGWSEADLLSSHISCGGRHSLLHLRNRVWAWGSVILPDIVTVCFDYCCLLCDVYCVFVSWNKFGQIGNGSLSNEYTPTLVQFPRLSSAMQLTRPDDIQQVCAGWRHSIARTKAGSVFVWGYNSVHFTVGGGRGGGGGEAATNSSISVPTRLKLPPQLTADPMLRLYMSYSSSLSICAVELLQVNHPSGNVCVCVGGGGEAIMVVYKIVCVSNLLRTLFSS